MHAHPIYANYHLKPVKFIMARLLVVKVIYFWMIFFSFDAATSLVSEANKLSEKSFPTNQNHFQNINDSCSKLGNQLCAEKEISKFCP